MKFCPTCDARLIKDDTTSILTCPECKYTENGPEDRVTERALDSQTVHRAPRPIVVSGDPVKDKLINEFYNIIFLNLFNFNYSWYKINQTSIIWSTT